MAGDTNVRTFDPKKVVITWGAIIFSGFADGTFLTIERNGDNFEKRRGADGSVDRINKNSDDYMVTVTLMQSALTNALLSAQSSLDRSTNLGIAPLTIVDLSGETVFFAPQAWIGKDPDDEFGDSLVNREWRLDTGAASKVTGGNVGVVA